MTLSKSPADTIINSLLIERMNKGLKLRFFLVLAAGLEMVLWSGCESKKTVELMEPASVLGTVVGDEALHLAGAKKKVLIISTDKEWGPPSATELALRKRLEKGGCAIIVQNFPLGDPMKAGIIGLKKEDFFSALIKASDCGAVVSLAGTPLMVATDANDAPKTHPPVIVVATAMLGKLNGVPGDRVQLARLLEAQVVQEGVIDSEPQPDAGQTADKTLKVFKEHYRFLRPNQ